MDISHEIPGEFWAANDPMFPKTTAIGVEFGSLVVQAKTRKSKISPDQFIKSIG